MKRLIFLLLPAALAISLWFNWQNHRSSAPPPPSPRSAPPPVPAAAVLPEKFGEMDFSGTALSDESWQLKQDGAPPAIPRALPGLLDPTPSFPPPPAAPPDWNPGRIPLSPDSLELNHP